MSVEYPIFAFEKDDHSMRLVESEKRILFHLEAIDIQNDEYVFWDATGVGVRITASVGAFKSKLESVNSCPAPFPIQEAFRLFAESLRLRESRVDGPPIQLWGRLQDLIGKPEERTIRRGTD